MSLTKCGVNTNVIENLPDAPNLPTEQLKQKFDEAGVGIKNYLNAILIDEIESLVATEKADLQRMVSEQKTILENAINEQKTTLSTEINNKILEDNKKKYYVGKIIMDTKDVNPATYLGFGTWQKWGQGRVPVGVSTATEFNTVEKTGGSSTHTHDNGKTGGPSVANTGSHVLTVQEIPSHSHTIAFAFGGSGSDRRVLNGTTTQEGTKTNNTGGGQGHTHSLNAHTHTIASGSNIQPYITCYMWKRVS